jgi:hypothetical protein
MTYQHITEDEWRLHNDLEDALTGQRLLDLPIVQTYADIVLRSEAHIREVQTRIRVETKCLIKEAEEEASKLETEKEGKKASNADLKKQKRKNDEYS